MTPFSVLWMALVLCCFGRMAESIRLDQGLSAQLHQGLSGQLRLMGQQSQLLRGGRQLQQKSPGPWDWIYQIDPFAKFPPGPPPQYFPPPPPPPPFELIPFSILKGIPDVIKGILQIPGAVIDMIWNQATMYGPVVGDILRGDQAGAQQKIIDGELRKTQDINMIVLGATAIVPYLSQYTAPLPGSQICSVEPYRNGRIKDEVAAKTMHAL